MLVFHHHETTTCQCFQEKFTAIINLDRSSRKRVLAFKNKSDTLRPGVHTTLSATLEEFENAAFFHSLAFRPHQSARDENGAFQNALHTEAGQNAVFKFLWHRRISGVFMFFSLVMYGK